MFRHEQGINMFLDGPSAKDRDSVHILFAGEKVRASDGIPAPEISEWDTVGTFQLLPSSRSSG